MKFLHYIMILASGAIIGGSTTIPGDKGVRFIIYGSILAVGSLISYFQYKTRKL